MNQPTGSTTARQRSRIAHRTAQLSRASRLLHRIDHLTSLPSVAATFAALVVASIVIGAGLGFPKIWVTSFEVTVSALTLLMVFAIQHTQAREVAATQRKLDELIRAIPGASERLIMLEEAPRETMQEVEEEHREVRSELAEEPPSWTGP